MKSNTLLYLLYIICITALLLISGCGKTAGEATTGKVVKETDKNNEQPKETNETQAEEPKETQEQDELPSLEELIKEQEQQEQIKEEPKSIVRISIKNLRFMPSEITVPAGTTVIWTHEDNYIKDMPHKVTVQSTTPPGVSPILKYGDSYNYTFTKPKKYRYVDPIYVEKMFGTITVK